MEDKKWSYTNSDGEIVEVDRSHLDKAVEIKLKLQEQTYGRKCNWHLHKKLMEESGFFNSDVNESYRCMIKRYQKMIGKLHALPTYAEYVTEGKLELIRRLVGEVRHEKLENMEVLREINKAKRYLSRTATFAEIIRDTMIDDIDWSFPESVFKPRLATSKNRAILSLTDWHIGAVVENVKGNSYNLDIAKKRLRKVVRDALDYCKLFNITELDVVHHGDATEHISMRKVNQPFESELGLSQQIVHAQRLLIEALVELAQHVNVNFSCLGGNHDRMNGSKEESIDSDNTMVVIAEGVRDFIRLSNIERLRYVPTEEGWNYEVVRTINGKRIKLVHGDLDWRSDANKLSKHSMLDRTHYDAIIAGHFHFYSVIERNYGTMEIYVGSLMGCNNYSRKNLKAASEASQAITIITEDGKIVPIRLDCQIV